MALGSSGTHLSGLAEPDAPDRLPQQDLFAGGRYAAGNVLRLTLLKELHSMTLWALGDRRKWLSDGFGRADSGIGALKCDVYGCVE